MDAVEYLKTLRRMCERRCTNCEFGKRLCGVVTSCTDWRKTHPEEAVAIAEKWAKKHPAKTRQSEFLEHYPNAWIAPDGMISISPCLMEPQNYPISSKDCESTPCDICRRKFWLAEVEE